MSGPKCIEIRRVPAAEARLLNREFCLSKLFYLRRVSDELRALQRQLDEVAISSANDAIDVSALSREVDRLLQRDDGFEAAQLCMKVAAEAEQFLNGGRKQFRQRVSDLQRRFLALEAGRQSILSGRESLTNLIESVVPSDWPEEEQAHLSQAAASVLDQVVVPDSVDPRLERGTIGQLERAEAVVESSLRTLNSGHKELFDLIDATHARLLTERLTLDSGNVQTLEAYVKAHRGANPEALPTADGIETKLGRLLAEIVALEQTAVWSDILRRGMAIREERDTARRQMLYEALVIDCSAHVKHLRTAERFRQEVRRLLDAAAPWKGTRVDNIVEELLSLERSAVPLNLDEVENRLNAAIEGARKDLEHQEKRRVVLQALAEIGYTAREGMDVALIHEGKCIVRRAGDKDYGVEVSIDRDFTMVETELVRFVADGGDHPSRQEELRDVRREESWCEDYKRARELLAEKYGWQSDLRYQNKPGQHPVKRVVDQSKRKRTRAATQRATVRSSRTPQDPQK